MTGSVRTHIIKRAVAASVTMALVIISGQSAPVGATQPNVGHKVTICHALPESSSHDYNRVTVDIASSGYVKRGHYVPGGALGDKHADGGDIIPPYTYEQADGSTFQFFGQNWTRRGIAIWLNDCRTPDQPPPPVLRYRSWMDVCGDPRIIGAIQNTGTKTFTVRLRFVSARDGSLVKVERTLEPWESWVFKRWVKGQTRAWLRIVGTGIYPESVYINRANNIGACPRQFTVAG